MSLLLNKIINGIIMSISGFGISNQLLGRKKKENWIEISLVILLVAAPAIVLYEMQYNAMVTVFTFVLSIFVYKNYFKESYTTCFLVSVTMMILTAITDIVWGTFLKLFVDIKAIREVWYIMIISNIMIGGLAILLAGNKTVKHLFSALAKKLSKKVYLSTILFLLLSLAVTIVLHVNMLTVMKRRRHMQWL